MANFYENSASITANCRFRHTESGVRLSVGLQNSAASPIVPQNPVPVYREKGVREISGKKKITRIDDGFHPWLVCAADFDSLLDMPQIKAPKRIDIPQNVIPFSKIAYSEHRREFVHFYEHDRVFKDFVKNPEEYIERLYPFSGVITPDCSLYRDMPLILQIANTYTSRAIGCFLQEQGINVIPNIRWGDERSYQPGCVEVPFAFLGVEKHSIVSVSTYGCIRGKENKRYFHDGFFAMLNYLKPEIVLIHGAMPADVFADVPSQVQCVHYQDWTTQKRKKVG